jgi:hypothetical protein
VDSSSWWSGRAAFREDVIIRHDAVIVMAKIFKKIFFISADFINQIYILLGFLSIDKS